MAALFGWHGLSLRHPDDWVPVSLSGDRRSGYARLASPRDLSLQVRWAPLGSGELAPALNRYLDRLAGDARRHRRSFDRDVHAESGVLRYRYQSELDGEGLLFPSGDGRVVFIEAVGESVTARRRVVQSARDSFATGTERWSVLGLDLTLPAPLRVERREFLAGRTALTLAGRGVRVTAERWGLAEGLLARRSLSEWVSDRLGRGWSVTAPPANECRAELRRKTLIGFDEALVRHQPDANQIVLLRVRSRDSRWRPQWDWLT